MNLPNSLTLARIVLVPLLVVVLLTSFQGHLVLGLPKGMAAALIFGIASLTDWLDGYLARRRKQITVLGQLLDPIADKLLTTAAFVSLVQLDMVQAWIVAVVIGRELAVTGLRGVAHTRGLVMPASGLGKLKMVAQVIAILALMLASDLSGEPGRWLQLLGLGAVWVVVGLALWSAVEYYQTFAAVISGRTAPPEDPQIDPAPAAGPVPERGAARGSAASARSGSALPGPASPAPGSVGAGSGAPGSAAPPSASSASAVPASGPSAALAGAPRRS
jgi:CDP-diacylglycerol--glycerol-3-phosphate 3-phosphatidyltransferase